MVQNNIGKIRLWAIFFAVWYACVLEKAITWFQVFPVYMMDIYSMQSNQACRYDNLALNEGLIEQPVFPQAPVKVFLERSLSQWKTP